MAVLDVLIMQPLQLAIGFGVSEGISQSMLATTTDQYSSLSDIALESTWTKISQSIYTFWTLVSCKLDYLNILNM